ncbi:MAG: hypoxanthine phosphoribosyltransferase, partial [Chloroflexi bacterium]
MGAQAIQQRVREMAAEISRDYDDLDTPLILLSVLKGSVSFATDLSRSLTIPVNFDYVACSSYG